MVKPAIVWDNEAKKQLKELYQYIKNDSPQNMVNVRTTSIEKVKQAVFIRNLIRRISIE